MSLRGEDALILAYDYTEKSLEDTGALKGQDGKDGVSPIISVNTSTEDTYKLDITDKNGTITTPNLVGKQGLQGIQGLQGTRGEKGDKGDTGLTGEKGADGVSPIVTENADNSDTIYKLDIVDANGTHTTPNLIGRQGVQGLKGDKGDKGLDGVQISDNETVEDKTWSSSKINSKLGGLSFSASGTTLTITNGTNTWTLEANS